ncbi:hemolysin III family protein [Turicibacter sp. TJ11]|uniref:PAQR family membrane homeostasis protein TrhA n=1 Tax=Turicibacter sp. TJ11 TaxID=2806443 RepID=UPI001F206C24|nr:hemolysin III family protein [Turicibacter sp. TJ11]
MTDHKNSIFSFQCLFSFFFELQYNILIIPIFVRVIFLFFIVIYGSIFKLAWFNCSRMLSTSIYILMGWLVIFAFEPLLIALSTNGVTLLIFGGVLYTIGGILYTIKPDWQIFKYFGYHEVFHIFILLGSLSYFLCTYFYVL